MIRCQLTSIFTHLLFCCYFRYPIGQLALPYFSQWVTETFDVDLNKFEKPQELPSEDQYPPSKILKEQLDRLVSFNIQYSVSKAWILFEFFYCLLQNSIESSVVVF